ncbi:Cof-type HAD-IIB family hydrolase [Neobacillus jeddahensis]|uniref:Cof-type HAD-IIB family hydrolase n=1 Tax=Neobacillus jeddahensis TaxID=1461580 RepID=UPI00058FE3CB|nr:Cof-type HAD-IIB family hydrolase [Neobacillus jeddahensis]
MKKQIVFFDIDGTLLTDDKIIPQSTKKAIQLLQAQGIYTAIATGRVSNMFYWVQKELNMESYVSMNGQYVVFEGQQVYANPIGREILDSLAAMAHKNGHALAYFNHQDYRVNKQNHPLIETSFDSLLMPYPEVDENFYKQESIYLGHLYCESKDEQIYKESFPTLNLLKWHDNAYDILPIGASKAVGISKLLENFDIPVENSFAFGDGLNDLEMLATVGTGIAMGNAVPEAKAAADLITTSSSEDGILNGLIEVGLLDKRLIPA